VSGIPGIEVIRGKTAIALALAGVGASEMALIKVTSSGLDFRLALSKAQLRSPRLKRLSARTRPTMTHQVLLSEASDLDEELLTWLKAAKIEARTSKGRSS
jgi:hypothetical protein